VPRHSIFGFLGSNGAGKTTLMKVLLDLSRLTAGSGTIFGHDILTESVAIRERIGYLPQQPRFIEHMTARENLLFAANFFFSDPQAKIQERCDEMLELVGLVDKADDRPIKGFSSGEKQRLGIALAQVNYPDLLVLDEPASALDPPPGRCPAGQRHGRHPEPGRIGSQRVDRTDLERQRRRGLHRRLKGRTRWTGRATGGTVLGGAHAGDTKFVQTHEAQGEPPYLGKSSIRPYSTLFGREYSIYEFPNIKSDEYRRDGDILMLMRKQPEYGWLDRVYYLLGLMNTFNAVYPQLQDIDFRLDLPVYLLLGRHDMNNPYWIPKEYFNLLQAPSKQLYFFEESGHGMIWEEADKFHDIMIHTVLPETYRP
jgi:pimeloyl-ACP methyl ester carboxylesterase